ncbi:cytochrome C oxidase subunit III [Novosphingobium sp. FGD1]|jgi:heme/copper-type cytochrome/quinol oxidase subunit 3|uniref:Cytochrome C oxidase subunit III n=1 Tax=Novosphingobium silvae TaxID=2692619 RepID=A0A7X4K7F3_9SPHN|nr:cytochrome c oxidase subunit 3 [Novosphingobium silvae]MYL97253.1 cytochrome C oxidase subunit III [Novosphingobium silvae]
MTSTLGKPPREIEIVGNLSNLPASARGPRNLVWWGNIGFMLIEGTGFALAAAAYLYLMTQSSEWPAGGAQPPGLFWSGLFTAGMLLSQLPNLWVLRCARNKNVAGTRIGTLAMSVIPLLLMAARAMEFRHLGVAWYDSAYGSAVWLLLVLHTTHLITEWGETVVIGTWLLTHEVGDDQFADVEDNSNYWTFVVLCWLPVYALVYWAPRAA